MAYIKNELEKADIKSPMGKDKWRVSTIESILRNEKYMGDALVQKKYVKNFLDHELVDNNGEVPQYFQKAHHEPIVEPDHWLLVQVELEKRKKLSKVYKSNNIFTSKLICGDCGGFYGQKVFHSTDKYKAIRYRCNDKYEGEHKCETPTLSEDDIKEKFLLAYSKFMGDRNDLIEDTKEMVKLLFDTEKLKKEKDELESKAKDIITLVEALIEKNKTTALNQDEYQKKFDNYDKEHTKITAKINSIEDSIHERESRAKYLDAFIKDLAERPLVLEEFDVDVWFYMIEKGIVNRDKTITFTFKNGTEIRI